MTIQMLELNVLDTKQGYGHKILNIVQMFYINITGTGEGDEYIFLLSMLWLFHGGVFLS